MRGLIIFKNNNLTMKALLLILNLLVLSGQPVIDPKPRQDSICLDSLDPKSIPILACSSNTPFANRKFNCIADFTKIIFPGPVRFNVCFFKEDAFFKEVTFSSHADFSDATFKRDADFSNSVFNRFLFMSHVTTDTLTDFKFYKAVLPRIIDFSQNKNLHTIVDMTDADFETVPQKNPAFGTDSRIFINIYNSALNKFRLDYLHFRLCFYNPCKEDNEVDTLVAKLHRQFTGKDSTLMVTEQLLRSPIYQDYIDVIFPSAKYTDEVVKDFTAFYVNRHYFFPERLSDDRIDELYACLLKNFDTHGQVDSFELLNCEYQDHLWAQHNFFLKWLYIFPKYWNYYGLHKEWILGWTLLLLLLFTSINFIRYEDLFGQPFLSNNAYYLNELPLISAQDPMARFKKLKQSLILTSLIFFSFSIKTEKMNYKRGAFFYIGLISIVGLVCLGYLANFVLEK